MILFNYLRGIRIILIKISGQVLSGGFRVVGAEAEYKVISRSYALRGNATVPARATTQSVGAR